MGASHVAQMVKNLACNSGDPGLIPESGKSPGEGNGNPLQNSCLENPMDWGAWQLQSMGSQRAGHDWASNTFTTQGLVLWKTIFPQMGVREGWFWNDSSTFHLLCMLFLWLSHQLFRISLGIRSRRLGTPDLQDEISSCFWDRQGPSWCRPRLLGHVRLWPFLLHLHQFGARDEVKVLDWACISFLPYANLSIWSMVCS